MRAIRGTFLTLSILMAANLSGAQEASRSDWKPLADFESVESFEKQLSGDQEDCLTNAGGGSMAVTCFKLYELWDRELNIQYRRLQGVLDEEGRKKLTESQRDWIKFRDSTIEFNSYVLAFTYSAPGTMWLGVRAEVADKAMAGIVRDRTLMLLDWEKRWSGGPVNEETILNEPANP